MQVELSASELKQIVRALIDKQAWLLNTLPKWDVDDASSARKRADALETIITKLTEEYVKI